VSSSFLLCLLQYLNTSMSHKTHKTHKRPLQRAIMDKRSKDTVNIMAYTLGVGGNLAALPQIIRAWNGSAPGLSVLTWILYGCMGLIWLVYAIQRKQNALIVAQIACILADTAVVAGWAVNNGLY